MDFVEKKRGLSWDKQVEHTRDLLNQIFQTFRPPGSQVEAGGEPSPINVPASLGTFICGQESSISYWDVRHSHLIDKVKEQVVTYGKVLKSIITKEWDMVPPCVKELIWLVGPYIPITEADIMRPWPIGGFLLADHRQDQRTGSGARARSEDPWVSSESCGGLEESQQLGEDDDSIIEVPQESKELGIIIINDENKEEDVEEVPAA